jgi:NADH:ubiquinone oxidoreductase subunit E
MSGTALHEAAEVYQPVFTGEVLERLQQILPRYPTKQAALLPALWLVQETRGWISDRDMAEVAGILGITPAYVRGVVTFYTRAKELGATSPDGKWTIIEVECLGACGFATPIMINNDFLESVTPERVPDLVKQYR